LRPVVIVADADSQADMIALPITGSDHHPHTLPLAAIDFAVGSMKKASFIRIRKPVTFNAIIVGRSFGQLTPKALARVRSEMCTALDCTK
jgi:hypothetical protein